MSDAGNTEYVPDHLYERLFQPWTLPEAEWPLCKEDWARVDAITALPWKGHLIDFGCGDGTLSAMVCSRNPEVMNVYAFDKDDHQMVMTQARWSNRGWNLYADKPRHQIVGVFDGALFCEVLEHLSPRDGLIMLCDIKRVLKPGAMLCVTVPLKGGSREVYPGHIRSFTLADIVAEVREAGFTVDERATRTIKDIWAMVVADA